MMNLRKTLLVAISATAFVALSAVGMAATDHDARERLFIRLSEDGSKAARDISLARVAIFDGQSQEATKLIDQAKAMLVTAAKDADKLAIKKPEKTETGPMVPIDARLTMADDFILTAEKREKIDKVNEHLKKGETKQALEILRPADVNLTLTTLFMPIEATSKAVDQAAELLAQNKYYEANLALKKAEDGWVVDSQSFVDYLADLPKLDKRAPDKQASAAPNPAKPETSDKQTSTVPNSTNPEAASKPEKK
ncbi:MAG: YfdX family protein [Candidatus Contendobacter sp.]|nr:YfdX family protein [Candidatus Contendobacter sp.]